MLRRLAAAVAALAMVLMLAAPAVAGNWAEIIPDAQTAEPPVEGQPVDVGFRVLQHGVTPAGWETATVHFTNASTGETLDVVASNDRDDGHFVADAVQLSAGYWNWRVTLKDLGTEQAPVALSVVTTSGALPAADQSATIVAIRAERDALATSLAAAEADTGFPLPAVIVLAVLAGAAAGYAASRLTDRRGPRVAVAAVSPAQREADLA
jgi:hypothetical protein